jgi:hypothetical protein
LAHPVPRPLRDPSKVGGSERAVRP